MTNLSEKDSAARMLDAADRHARLCRQKAKGAKFETSILPPYNELKAMNDARKAAEKSSTVALDLVHLFDEELKDLLRKLHNRSTEFDRANPGANTCKLLFADGLLTPVVSMGHKEKADEAQIIVQKLEKLGSTHELYALADEIGQQVQSSLHSILSHENMLKAEASAWGNEEIAKFALQRQYSQNYHNAVSEFDKNFAEKLFPNLRPVTKKDEETPEDSTSTKAS